MVRSRESYAAFLREHGADEGAAAAVLLSSGVPDRASGNYRESIQEYKSSRLLFP